SSMRGQHERIVTRMDLNIVDANQRQVSFQTSPSAAAIKGNVSPKLSSQEQQILIARMLANNARGNTRWYVRLNGLPRFAKIRCHKDVGVVVVRAMTIKREIRRTFSVSRRNNPTDVGIFGSARNLFSNVFPGLAAVTRDL